MKTTHWIKWSQGFYRLLLYLYPKAYRAAYEMEMLHVFTDQCRDTYKQRGSLGILLLWPGILVDVIVTAITEHLTDPQAKFGLLEAIPNAPLPWKGVLLVLIPGLIFFISQVEQLTSNQDWFFFVHYRAAYFLILPVLLVWMFTRRFPVWGLIPLGLLYATLGSYNPSYLISKLPFFRYPNALSLFNMEFDPGYLISVSACVVLLCGLIWHLTSSRQIPQNAWKWLGIYGLLIILQIIGESYRFIFWQGWDWATALNPINIGQFFIPQLLWYFYDSLPFLVLVFIGVFFARKYDGLGFLLLLGYLLPTIVFGRYGQWNESLPFYLIGLAVLIYRFVVALVAPIWLVREASIPGRQRAAAIPVAIAIVSQISLNIIVFWATAGQNSYQPGMLDFALTIWSQLIMVVGLGLAVTLYLQRNEQTNTSPPVLISSQIN